MELVEQAVVVVKKSLGLEVEVNTADNSVLEVSAQTKHIAIH